MVKHNKVHPAQTGKFIFEAEADIEKSLRGSEKPGHKYIKRTPLPGGGYGYVYTAPELLHEANKEPLAINMTPIPELGGQDKDQQVTNMQAAFKVWAREQKVPPDLIITNKPVWILEWNRWHDETVAAIAKLKEPAQGIKATETAASVRPVEPADSSAAAILKQKPYQIRGLRSFEKPEERAMIQAAWDGMSDAAKEYAKMADVPILYLSRKEIESMPPSLRAAVGMGQLLTWNYCRINIPEPALGKPLNINSQALEHEMLHMAYPSVDSTIKAAVLKDTYKFGRKIVQFVKQYLHDHKADHESLTDAAATLYRSAYWSRKDIMATGLSRKTKQGKDIGFTHDLSLGIPSSEFPVIAQHLGLITDSTAPGIAQYCQYAVNHYIVNHVLKTKGTHAIDNAEEPLTYGASLYPEIAEAAFKSAIATRKTWTR